MIGDLRTEVAVSMEREPVYSQQTRTDRGHMIVLLAVMNVRISRRRDLDCLTQTGEKALRHGYSGCRVPRYAATGGRNVADYFGRRSADGAVWHTSRTSWTRYQMLSSSASAAMRQN